MHASCGKNMESTSKKTNDLLNANQAFYKAFAAGDFSALVKVLAEVDGLSVIHPGSTAILGRDAVLASWENILQNSGGSTIQCRNATAHIHGDMAYVICHEVFPEGQLTATNIFIIEHGEWRMVHHQAGPETRFGAGTQRPGSLH